MCSFSISITFALQLGFLKLCDSHVLALLKQGILALCVWTPVLWLTAETEQ